jgi:hypothetical protein
MDEYQTGDLVEAAISRNGEIRRAVLTYIPEPAFDGTEDAVPWRELVPNSAPGGGWFTHADLTDIVPLVAVPRLSREQIVDALAPECPDRTTAEDVAPAVLGLMGQPVPEDEE